MLQVCKYSGQSAVCLLRNQIKETVIKTKDFKETKNLKIFVATRIGRKEDKEQIITPCSLSNLIKIVMLFRTSSSNQEAQI